jgi:hypothetical protein
VLARAGFTEQGNGLRPRADGCYHLPAPPSEVGVFRALTLFMYCVARHDDYKGAIGHVNLNGELIGLGRVLEDDLHA